MRVMFVSINKLKSYRPVLPIGMVTVATQARAAGHVVHCVDLMFEEDDEAVVRREASAFRPAAVGLSIRNVDSLNLLEPAIYTPLAAEIADWCRECAPRTYIVLGGAGFTTVPEELMEFVGADYGVVGFAEQSFVELLACLEHGREPRDVNGIIYPTNGGYYRKPPSFTIDYESVLPPDTTLYDPRYFEYTFETLEGVERVAATVQTKKGCVLECTFCSNFLIDGTGVRLKAATDVADDIERIAAMGIESFEIVDGVFNLPLHHALEVLRELERRRIDLPWSCMINPGAVNEELVELLARTGCREVEFGTDSLDDRVLARLKKNFRRRRVFEVHRMFRRAGIRTMHCLFLGSPGDNRDSVLATIDGMEELVPAGARDSRVYWTFGLRICRGTDLYRTAIDEGMIRGDELLLVPKYYVSPAVLEDDALLDTITTRMLANQNWYLWWGLQKIPLRERLQMAIEENAEIERLVEDRLRSAQSPRLTVVA